MSKRSLTTVPDQPGRIFRSEFGMSYAVDNGWVGDVVELIIEFEARRQ